MALSTTHYDLFKPEGTDVFNPLVTEAENMDKIDVAIYDAKKDSVSESNCVKSGNIYAITRRDASCAMFRFVSQYDYVAGETFLVDSVQVTAQMANGESLSSGAFKNGSTVLASLSGTTLTIYTNAKTGTAEDSNKLGGQLPSYYATAQSVEDLNGSVVTVQQLANTANTTANEAKAEAAEALSKTLSVLTVLPFTSGPVSITKGTSGDIVIPLTPMEGMTPVAVGSLDYSGGYQTYVALRYVQITESECIISLRNNHTSNNATITANVTVLYMRTE